MTQSIWPSQEVLLAELLAWMRHRRWYLWRWMA